MRLGLVPSPNQRTWHEVLAFHLAADQIPLYESVWTADHFSATLVPPGATSPQLVDGPVVEAWSATAALAALTSRIRIGPLVTCAAFRHPALLARMVSVCDIVSNGRVNLALGGGWSAEEARRFGIDFGSLDTRMARLEEYLEVVTALFESDAVQFSGRFYELDGARLNPKPVQRPRPPILVAGTNARVVPLVARYAQSWDIPFATADRLPEYRDALAEACAAIDRDPSEIEISTVIYHDPREDLAGFAERVAACGEHLDVGIIALKPEVDVGLLEPLTAALMAAGLAADDRPAMNGVEA